MVDNLCVPHFLYRPRTPESIALADDIISQTVGAAKIWAPMRSASEIRRREMAPGANLYVDNKDWPCQVVTTTRENLQLHANYETFLKSHDFEDFPVRRTFSGSDVTYIVVKSDLARNSLSDKILDVETDREAVQEQNGVKRPKSSSITGRAWAVYDQYHKDQKPVAEAFKLLADGGMNMSTVRTQFSHWRKFNNIAK